MVHSPRLPFIFHRRGSTAIEYAIVLPVLLMFVLGIIDAGRLLWTYVTIYRATEAAARCAAIKAAAPDLLDFGPNPKLCGRRGVGAHDHALRFHGQQSGVRNAGPREL